MELTTLFIKWITHDDSKSNYKNNTHNNDNIQQVELYWFCGKVYSKALEYRK